MNRRLFAALVCVALLVALLPATAFAEGSGAIQLGTDGIGVDDYIYFGKYSTYDVPWLVLSKAALPETSTAAANTLSLLSKFGLGSAAFQLSGSGYYPGSTLQSAMTAVYNGFDPREQAAIAITALDGSSMHATQSDLGGQKLFPLSQNELSDSSMHPIWLITNQTRRPLDWWLRSSESAQFAYEWYTTFVLRGAVTNYRYVRPAFHLDLSKVLFTSAAAGGKSAAGMESGLAAVSTTPPTEWKLTLKDNAPGSGRENFGVSTAAVSTTTEGGSVSIVYSGAKVRTDSKPEYLSAMIVDSSDNALYYGRLKSIAAETDAGGTQEIAIPAGLATGSYTLRIFNEQYNGDNKTDYSSAFEDVTLTVTAPVPPTVTDPTANRTVPVTVGNPATLSVTATGATGYQWQINRNDGNDFVPIPGATGASYATAPVTLANNGYQYRCVVTSNGGSITSPVFTLNVTEPMDVPATGDSSTPTLWLGILLLAGAALTVNIALYRRKRKTEN